MQLDPDYLSAWRLVAGLPASVTGASEVRQAAALNTHRLDPRQRHTTVTLDSIHDLKQLWKAVDSIQHLPKPKTAPLYKLRSVVKRPNRQFENYDDWRSQPLASPAQALLSTSAFEAVVELMEQH